MSFSDNIIRSKDGNWQIVIDEDAEGAHIRCTGKTETKEDLMKHGLTEEQARDIVIAVLSGKVRHLAMMF